MKLKVLKWYGISAKLLNDCAKYGFKDKSSVIRNALEQLKEKLELKSLEKSSDLYVETYEQDSEKGADRKRYFRFAWMNLPHSNHSSS